MARELFGGAIVCDFPSTYEDVSYLREIPDNEEVFHEPATDSCLVIDLTEYSAEVSDEKIAEYQFEDIADGNQVRKFNIEEKGIASFPNAGLHEFFWCGGVQEGIIKFKEDETKGNDVYVWVGVGRMKKYNTDVVISVTAPMRLSEKSSSFALGSVPDVARGKNVFETALSSIKVMDYGLFAC